MRIFIDCGHGAPPKDTGAIGLVNEEVEVRKIARLLAAELVHKDHTLNVGSAVKGYTVQESLEARCSQANEWNADLFVSLHLNAFEKTGKPMGCEAVAITPKAQAYAFSVCTKLSELGLKNRGVKNNEFYVLTHTDAVAILVESFFIDSVADVAIYQRVGAAGVAKAIAVGIQDIVDSLKPKEEAPVKPPATTPVPVVTAGLKVKDILSRCDTGLARNLSLQAIAKMNRMVRSPLLTIINHPLIDVDSTAVNPFLQAPALQALIKAVEQRGCKMVINSCYRTAIQQHILKQQLINGSCGLTAVAPPGKGGHENGRSIDIEDASGWKPYLEDQGWTWIGSFDPMHFDYFDSRSDIARIGLTACQLLHNANNSDQLAEDGSYGALTAKAINNMPIGGYE